MVKFNVVRISWRYLCPGVVWICVIWLNVCICFRSQEGSQYVRGFGGIGGMLRYTVDFQVLLIYNLLELFCDLRKSDICVKNLYLDRSKKVFFVFFSRYSWMIWTEKSLIWTIIKEENSAKNDEMDGRMSLRSFNSDEMLLKTRLPDSCLFIWAIQI